MRVSGDLEAKLLAMAEPPLPPVKASKFRNVQVFRDANGNVVDPLRPLDYPKPWTKVADSLGEFRRRCELELLEQNGLIRDLQCQVKYELRIKGILIESYVADFVYLEGGKTVVEDYKGAITKDYRRKKKWMKAIHGIEITETKRAGKPQRKAS
jgi:hypothetical protein